MMDDLFDVESRRAFLKKTAALAGAGAILSATGCATNTAGGGTAKKAAARPPLRDADPVRMAVIGTGGMGNGHLDSFMNFRREGKERVDIVAVCDVCSLKADEAQKKCANGQSGVKVDKYINYHEVLARPDIHAVLLAVPEHWHGKMGCDAILAGKDTYLEKPMTLRLSDAMDLYHTSNANPDVIFQVGTQKMQLPKFHEAHKAIAAGAIGKPTMSQTSYCRNSKDGEWLYYEIKKEWEPGKNLDWDMWCGPLGKQAWDPAIYARWRRYRRWSTGIIGDLLVHEMTPLVYAMNLGWPTRVTCAGGHYIDKAMENHDTVNLTIEFENEHTMIVAGATNNEQGLPVMIRGHKGTIRLNSRHCEITPESTFESEMDPKHTIECPDIGDDQDAHRRAWLKCIRTREKPLADVTLGTKVMVIVDLATRSAWDGHAYAFDPKTMKASRV